MVTPRQYDAELDHTFSEEITFTCPVRGEVIQIVMINKYKPLNRKLVRIKRESTDDEAK